ncbi:LCP family protein [[Clostridium] innocuum]|uniref:LCP family protein n=1 Tax=Clostridium innocuum TaxID=1522 RepID=UPI001F05B1BB|nr:LCP family protein [[Clostridium] innocuum]MCH1947577.1 LCP family protein [[Clostridium] innocuum]
MQREMDYTTLYDQMEQGNVSAMAISETFYNMSKANIKDFEKNVQILKTYSKTDTIKTKEQKDITKQTFTVYLSGLDSTVLRISKTRTDTNLLLRCPPVANHIDMVSIPRDALVPNTALNNANDKADAYRHIWNRYECGHHISQFFGIPVDYYARVSFNSMIEIVDTIGGIDVDVELDFCEQDENRSFKKDDLICLKKGEQHLDGKQALAYSATVKPRL